MKKRYTIILLIITAVFVVAAITFRNTRNDSPGYPEIKFYGDEIKVRVDADDKKLLEGVTATDPEDGDVTDSLIVEGASRLIDGKNIIVTYAAFDSQNHVTKAERTVKFSDYKSPHFTMSAPMIFTIKNSSELLSCVGAEDVFDGDISRNVKFSIDKGISFSEEGEYNIELTVTNKLGDKSTLPVTVEITEEDVKPEAIVLTDYLVYIDEGDDFDPTDYVESYTVGNTEHTSASGLKIKNDVDTEELGVYTVEYSYTSGKTGFHTRLIVVVE